MHWPAWQSAAMEQPMKIEFDQQADAMYIRLRAGTVAAGYPAQSGIQTFLMPTLTLSLFTPGQD